MWSGKGIKVNEVTQQSELIEKRKELETEPGVLLADGWKMRGQPGTATRQENMASQKKPDPFKKKGWPAVPNSTGWKAK